MCEFCAEFRRGSERIVTTIRDYHVLPTIGAFREGYCLLMPRAHVLSFAELAAVDPDLEMVVEQAVAFVSDAFGPVVVAEHGSDACGLGAGCCTHAHLHLLPSGNREAVVDAYCRQGGAGTPVRSIADLAAYSGQAYMYVQVSERLCWPAAGFPRQFVRRVASRLAGVGDQWDWRDHPFTENVRRTIERLRQTEAA